MTAPQDSELSEPLEAQILAQRTLRAIADAQDLRAQYHTVRARLMVTQQFGEQLRGGTLDIWDELRQHVESLAREQRASGRAPERMLVLLKELIDDAGIDQALRHEIEPDVIRWGIDAFYAA